CKKLRGLLRMVKPHFKNFADENAAARDAADLLGGVRDARVMVETLDALVADKLGHAAAAQAIAARQVLVARVEQLAQDSDQAATLKQFASMFSKIASRIEHWEFTGRGFEVIGAGLEQTFRQFCKTAAEAQEHETAEALHEWRKQAKYHGHHVALLSGAAPDLLQQRGKLVDRLGDELGDHHNLAVLQDKLELSGLDNIEAILVAIAAKQHELAQSAFVLGRQLAAEKPAALQQRFAGYWHLLPEEN
ncbi:MAG: hypothetical protein JWQ22_2840, partial [Devosia sp.]|nr:hypothetical protein [Devosia sp.]